MTDRPQTVLPRWRGFNFTEMCTAKTSGRFVEDDFRWIADWGFDFVRLPMSYRLWIVDDDPLRIDEGRLAEVDRAIDLGERFGLHVSLNLHRAPGFCVNPPVEPFNLWTDADALDAFCLHWETFARRYRGVPSSRVSFNLLNEPASIDGHPMTRADHERVMREAIRRIRLLDPERVIIVDGIEWGKVPLEELADAGAAQGCRAYWPHGVSHYKAGPSRQDYPEPVWPGVVFRGERWDRAKLEAHYAPWADLARQGVGVHCGEGGCFRMTPHRVFLAWFRDVLEILTAHNIGWALWNLRGPFGLLDSQREDVKYEDHHGHALDRELLELLRES